MTEIQGSTAIRGTTYTLQPGLVAILIQASIVPGNNQ